MNFLRLLSMLKTGLHKYEEDHTVLPSPERGWYVGYNLVRGGDAKYIYASGKTLVMCLVELAAYRVLPLPGTFLTALEKGFSQLRATGVKAIIRFRYSADADEPDTTKAWMLKHIGELAPLLQRNADVIVVIQMGMVGSWGEGHSSTNGLDNDNDRSDLLHAQLTQWPGFVCVRTPSMKRAYIERYGLNDRIGFFNDCLLASDSDFGTYHSAEDHAYFDNENGPVGGETCSLFPPRSDGPNALIEMAKDRISYLNAEYNEAVLGVWVATGHFPLISERLGYRLVLNSATFSNSVRRGTNLRVNVQLKNLGFAAPFSPRKVYVGLLSSEMQEVTTTNINTWRPSSVPITFTTQLAISPTTDLGLHKLKLWMPDSHENLRQDPRYAIRCMNKNTWDATLGMNILGTVNVRI